MEGNGRRHFLYITNPGDIADAYLNVGTPPYDHLPGGYFPWYDQLAESVEGAGGRVEYQFYNNASFIPTISALDVNTTDAGIDLASYGKSTILNNTVFDDIWWDTSHGDLRHNESTSAISDWIYDQIIAVEGDNGGRKSRFYNNTQSSLSVSNAQIHKAANNLTIQGSSTVTNTGQLELLASNRVTLKPGFHARQGSILLARIGDVSEADCSVGNDLNSGGRLATGEDMSHENFVSRDTIVNGSHVQYILSGGTFEIEENVSESPLAGHSLSVYPNPTVNLINVQGFSDSKIIIIYDGEGKQLETYSISGTEKRIQIDMAQYKSGTYFLVSKGVNHHQITKIIKR